MCLIRTSGVLLALRATEEKHLMPAMQKSEMPACSDGAQAIVLEGWWVGQRVIDDEGFRGTVRYIGPVATSKDPKAVWIGVEWDDVTRGKHDGSVVKDDGTVVRHFTCHCREGQSSASFMKPNKLDRGVGFMEVIHKRYVALDAPLEAPNQVFEGAYANTSKGGQKQIEFLGEEKIRGYQQIPRLEKVSMRGERVAWAGEAVAEEAHHLVEVDLQGNLLSDWEEIGRLTRQMPRLETLHLNSNHMLPLRAPPSEALHGSFACLRTLILNNCGIDSWQTVAHLQRCLPLVQELALARNSLVDLEEVNAGPIVQGWEQLRSLDLSGSGLTRWTQVALFSRLPHLTALHLNENSLETIDPAPPGEEATYFPQLESLHLSANLLHSWASIDVLNTLPKLVSLRFTNNPLTRGMGQSEVRQLLIARVAGLTRLNGAEISKKERMEAEKSYIRRVARTLDPHASDDAAKADILRAHPRWAELRALHGESMFAAGGSEGTGSLAKEMLSLKLVSMAASSMTMPHVEKRLPGSMLVSQLKLLVSKLFKLEAEMQVLTWRADKDSLPTPLDRDDEALSYFGLGSGCEVFVHELDLQERAKEEEARRREEQERLEEQMRQVDMLSQLRRAQVSAETVSVQQQAAKGGAASHVQEVI